MGEGELTEAGVPYPSNDDLPFPIRNHLPAHAQDIYREAFNHCFASHAGDRSTAGKRRY